MNNTEQHKKKTKPANPSRIQEFSEKRALFLASIEVLKAKRKFIILTFLLATLGTLMGHVFQTTTYTATSTLFVQTLEEPTAAEYLLNHQIGRLSKGERIETYMRYLSSDAFFLAVAQKVKNHDEFKKMNFASAQNQSLMSLAFWKTKLIHLLEGEQPTDKMRTEKLSADELSGLLKQITFFETDYSHFVHIKTKTLEPRTAQIIANIAIEEFTGVTNQRGIHEIEQIKNFVENKIKETEERLRSTEIEMIDFKKKNNLISTDTSSNLIAERYTRIASELESSKLQFEENQKLIQFFEKGQKTNMEAAAPSAAQSYGIKETAMVLQKKLEQLKKEKAVTIAQEDKNQDLRIKQIDEEIKRTARAYQVYASKVQSNLFVYMNPQKLQQKINELKEENEILRNKIATHSKAIDEVKSQIEKIPILAQKQLLLENSIRLDTESYTNLKNKLTELEIQRISQKKEVRIDQLATLPGPSIKGNLPLKLIFTTLISLFLGICIIIGIEALDPTIKHRSDLNDCNLEFIGEIPLIDSLLDKNKSKKNFASPEKLVCLNSPESLEAMSFKYIRARLESYKYKFKKEHMIISISSSAVSEGKSFISANLAVSLSQLKRKVLLIDCDLRRPSQNGYFDVTSEYGLVDLLNMTKSLDDVLIKGLYSNLDFLPAGFCNSSSTEIISSEVFKALLNHLKPYYDYVVIDTSPVFAAVDASIISNYSDIPILISNFRETKKVNLNDAYNQLLQVSYKRVFGIINKAILSSARFHYYGYHNYSKMDQNVGSISNTELNSTDVQKFLENLKRKTS